MSVLRAFVTFLFCFSPLYAAIADTKFEHRDVARDAARYEAYLKKNWKRGPEKLSRTLKSAEAQLLKDPRAASRSFAAAVVKDDQSPRAWLGLARALLAIDPDKTTGSERYDLPVNASASAYIAYQRAISNAEKARSLTVLSSALQRRAFWRPAIEALKVSLRLTKNAAVEAALLKLQAEHGFRMTDYKTDAEAASPRICLEFSELLSRAPVDFAKFVSVDGVDPQSIRVEGRQLCVESLIHGKRYEIQIRAGLPSDIGEDLTKTISIAAYLPDRKPTVRFTGRGLVLPSRGQQGIPVVSVNTDKIDIEVYRIGDRSLSTLVQNGDLERQLSNWDLTTIKQKSGEHIYKGFMDVAVELNKDVTTAFPVSEAIQQLKPGAYAMVARPGVKTNDNGYMVATQWFIVSDLGLTAFSGDDGVHGFVRSLATARPVAGVDVKLVARNNEILGTTKTDDKGYVRFAPGLARGEGGLQPALLVAQTGPTDYAFLDLTSAAFDLSDRGVDGRQAPGPIDGFLYTERGVYRPGEDVHLSALVRTQDGKAAGLPVTLIVSRPDGVEHHRTTLADRGLGGRTDILALNDDAMTGTWRAKLYVDPKGTPIAETAYLVEDFVPERLDMTLKPQGERITFDSGVTVAVDGRYLYGPPAADLALEGDIIVKQATGGVPGYAGYAFGLTDEVISPVRDTLDIETNTGADGTANIAVMLPKVPKTAKPLTADVLVRLRESGGRTIERRVSVPVELGLKRLGIKPLFENAQIGEGETAKFNVVLLDENGKPSSASGAKWTLQRLDTTWQWYSRDGYWSYQPLTITRKVANGTIDITADAPASLELPVDYGQFVIEIAAGDAGGPVSSFGFNAGWYSGGDAPESPEMLDVALDKPNYTPGETAKLRIATKHAGTALVAVLNNDLKHMTEVDIPTGGGDVSLIVGDDWGAGAYVVALMYRAMDEHNKRMPGRAVGVQWLKLDQSARTLNVTLEGPAKIRSGEPLHVPVKIGGLKAGEEAHITVAAVDVGILNLTRFKSPVPENRFYAQTRLGSEIRDFYGRLIDGMRAERGRLRSGGDGSSGMQMQGSPPVEETVAEFSGIVLVGADGTARVDFDLPDFNGSVRLMAVAWSADKLGHASHDIIVRDPVALTISRPRFLRLGDEARLALDVHNVEGSEAAYRVSLTESRSGGTSREVLGKEVTLKAGERRTEVAVAKPQGVGIHTYKVRVSGPGGVDVAREMTFDVKPPSTNIKRTTVSELKAGGKLTLSDDLVQDLIAERTRISLSVGPTARFDVPGLLTQLDRYPYGCAEQTVSRALPLLYVNAVAKQAGVATDSDITARVQKAVDRVFAMQDSSGAFGAWGPAHTNTWLTSYVTDFLTRAKETGYLVNTRKFGQALDRLQNFIAYAQDFKAGGEARAYALYVLARNGRAPIGELRYYADTRIDRFSTPLAKAQIGAALAMAGDKTRSEKTFALAMASIEAKTADLTRNDYGSYLRDGAALVTLTSEARVAQAKVPDLIDVVADAYTARSHTSTQEQAWLLLAAHALGDKAGGLSLTLDGKPQSAAIQRSYLGTDLSGNVVEVVNTGDQAVDTMISIVGDSTTPEPAVSKGFKIARSYFTLDGKPVDLGGTDPVAQNDRFVAVLSVTTENTGGRVLLVDRLPAGLEIENPRLVDSGSVSSLSWLKTDVRPEHTEFRDDRFVAAFNLSGNARDQAKPAGTTASVAYIVRAVTPGQFVHPAASVEDMYRPERYARTAAKQLEISAQ